jgi:uncharacterized phiE125 gp8 family phage protein
MRGVVPTIATLITAPVREPLDLDEVKKHLKFSPTTEDTLIDGWIAGEREAFEQETGIQIMSATYEFAMPYGPACREIELPHPPVQAIVSVTYDDADDVAQTWDTANYELTPSGATCRRGRLVLASGVSSWPATTGQPRALRIRYTAGFGDAMGDVPQRIKDALYLLVASRHRNRSEIEGGDAKVIAGGAAGVMRTYKHNAMPTLEPRDPSWA